MMEAFLDACEGAGCRKLVDGKWWVDQQGIEEAIATYALRVAPIEEEAYFTFARVTETDAPGVPKFLARTGKPQCTILVQSRPAQRLKQAALTIKCQSTRKIVGKQQPGPAALARYKVSVTPWLDYDLCASFDEKPPIKKEVFAVPPFCETMFEE